ncbi:conserved Plasmodium protein, unknown function [Plasmodium knowlesi strain H]|uniref:Uncharacterized protein n=3 Tax=Plasmodium knowlesi TaxID=5850 RepID=A0A5K1V4G8_PLAKH|nr:heptatricopeptide repeat-containing protein, putative [Plasmodium knowlesi strain H]OTN65380.1 Uncharacterized protein PKNOH_S110110100 [Plasmodium knowlesi]CAA9989718.1 heptatricopeptide repeat-containing protein, putative [Plasmodium knowlesi strain H]SBO22872.1 conserved Plasmodium protein, unknown function [Plasmodium knowlesi strain H]SBO23029.1 conserved Plasmodium protein, unknown function [Plasmodium knowlesi strain H]VVS79192.1 heptatricopeptide repeat-containing protein, putative |eukprot:XP_002260441.1 hypothetical protein, conserved in Plasmodium species [Plasmodium knowlesi strain H]
MRKLLKTAIADVNKITCDDAAKSSIPSKEKLKSLIIKNIDKFENEEILKIIEKYNGNNGNDRKILRSSYDVFKNNIHRYSFDQINRILRLYTTSQMYDNQFNVSILGYLIKRLNAMPANVVVNVFHNLVKAGLRDHRSIEPIKDHIEKNLDAYNTLDLTIILSSFTMLQEDIIMNIANGGVKESLHTPKVKNQSPECAFNYNEIIAFILNKIKNDEDIHNNLSVINSILILNMISRLNVNNYEIFKFFTKKYYKNLKERDVEPHHLTLLLNSFAKCNININILKYIIKYMNKDNFINQLSYVNITNAVHYMAKFNYKNTLFLNRLKDKVIEIVDTIPQREFSNIMWSLSKLKVKDDNFYFISLQKVKEIIPSMDMMSIAQVLDALRRRNLSSEVSFLDKLLDPQRVKNDTCDLPNKSQESNKHNGAVTDKSVESEDKRKGTQTADSAEEEVNSESSPLGQDNHASASNTLIQRTDEFSTRKVNNVCHVPNELEKNVIDLLIQKYLENIERCSLHVLTQVPFCCLQLNCTNYEIYYKSLEVLRRKKKYMSTLNLIYARYFIRILIEKQEDNFQKLPRSVKQFAREIMNSDNT